MKNVLYAASAVTCALVLALTLWLPSGTTQADPPTDRPGRGHSTAVITTDSLLPNCSISCSDGTNTSTEVDNAGECACDCAEFCDSACTASGGGQTATCEPN